MMITLLLSHTFLAPISRNDLMANGPVKSWIIAASMFASTISPEEICCLPEAVAKIFSIMFMIGHLQSAVSI